LDQVERIINPVASHLELIGHVSQRGLANNFCEKKVKMGASFVVGNEEWGQFGFSDRGESLQIIFEN
jgi:hypothetical protein